MANPNRSLPSAAVLDALTARTGVINGVYHPELVRYPVASGNSTNLGPGGNSVAANSEPQFDALGPIPTPEEMRFLQADPAAYDRHLALKRQEEASNATASSSSDLHGSKRKRQDEDDDDVGSESDAVSLVGTHARGDGPPAKKMIRINGVLYELAPERQDLHGAFGRGQDGQVLTLEDMDIDDQHLYGDEDDEEMEALPPEEDEDEIFGANDPSFLDALTAPHNLHGNHNRPTSDNPQTDPAGPGSSLNKRKRQDDEENLEDGSDAVVSTSPGPDQDVPPPTKIPRIGQTTATSLTPSNTPHLSEDSVPPPQIPPPQLQPPQLPHPQTAPALPPVLPQPQVPQVQPPQQPNLTRKPRRKQIDWLGPIIGNAAHQAVTTQRYRLRSRDANGRLARDQNGQVMHCVMDVNVRRSNRQTQEPDRLITSISIPDPNRIEKRGRKPGSGKRGRK